MWIALPFGFFSIVAHRDKPDRLLVRARVRADIESFAARLTHARQVRETPEADYPYRLTASRRAVARMLEHFTHDELTYDNFKARVGHAQGAEREAVYAELWAVLRRALGGVDKQQPKP
jgi:hypothetical protein